MREKLRGCATRLSRYALLTPDYFRTIKERSQLRASGLHSKMQQVMPLRNLASLSIPAFAVGPSLLGTASASCPRSVSPCSAGQVDVVSRMLGDNFLSNPSAHMNADSADGGDPGYGDTNVYPYLWPQGSSRGRMGWSRYAYTGPYNDQWPSDAGCG
jgi:hypothetical protein